ncbi:MAG: collagen-like protein [Prolixibacteraceae bacterium]|jgi:hypothetical protein|nr:collagen-like protein [Prolixibacteraceae bacterium]MBT6007071.1 collagen-like protein [Prolixibacteraceae bacterium]MBT6763133.1 collagen-like protein [Prolixibacteraceae bacterium]MBT6999235.1 collagen-like protein [Prolixibacteraceae bacterium]MBT7393282.1 collagen-like protein [Prolixibacteraceae bacterium]
MKTITGAILLLAIIILTSCQGVPGPPGYDGVDGIDGETLIGSIFEIQGDFTSQNDYILYFEFPNDFEIYDGDVVLVYILWEQASTNDGGTLDVWRLLPQTVVLEEGVLQYNFDYTLADVQIFLEGSIDLSTLLPAEADNQIFRIAVLPAAFAKNEFFDINNLGSIMKSLEIDLNSIERIDLAVDNY